MPEKVLPKLPRCSLPTITKVKCDGSADKYRLRCWYTPGKSKKQIYVEGGIYDDEVDANFEAISKRKNVILPSDWM